jgi:hypothetical protein
MQSQGPALAAERSSRDPEQSDVAIVFTGLGLVTLIVWVWLSDFPGLGYFAVAAIVAEAFIVAWFDDWRTRQGATRAAIPAA